LPWSAPESAARTVDARMWFESPLPCVGFVLPQPNLDRTHRDRGAVRAAANLCGPLVRFAALVRGASERVTRALTCGTQLLDSGSVRPAWVLGLGQGGVVSE